MKRTRRRQRAEEDDVVGGKKTAHIASVYNECINFFYFVCCMTSFHLDYNAKRKI